MDAFQQPPHHSAHSTHRVRILAGAATIYADLTIPVRARGIVLFAHGSGSSRFSQRNRWVASELQWGRLATLIIDLLTDEEASRDQLTGEYRFDIQLLARRVVNAVDWAAREPATGGLPIGLFGANTGAAAAFFAAVRRPNAVRAVVSRGGRPDLAESALPLVDAPTLLIVGENDPDVLALNREALSHLKCPSQLEVVPGASHLWGEPGALEAVATLAREWFVKHFHQSALADAARVGW